MSLYIISGQIYQIDRPVDIHKVPGILRGNYMNQSSVNLDIAICLGPEEIRRRFQPLGTSVSDGFKIDPLTALIGQFSCVQSQDGARTYRTLEKKISEKKKVTIDIPIEKIPKELMSKDLGGEYFTERIGTRFFLYRIQDKSPMI